MYKKLKDYWIANKCRYEEFKGRVDEGCTDELLKYCAYAIARVWAWYLRSERDPKLITEISAFTHETYPVFECKEWPISLRIFAFLSRLDNRVSFTIAYMGNQLYRHIKPRFFG